MKDIKVVVFDLDGTIEDVRKGIVEADKVLIKTLAKKLKLPKDTIRQAYETSRHFLIHGPFPRDHDRWYWLKLTLQRLNKTAHDDYLRELIDTYWDILNSRAVLFSGVGELLDRLHKNHKLVLLTDSDGLKKYKMDRLHQLGIEHYFDAIVTSDDVGFNKPDRHMFDVVLRMFAVEPEHCLMVGDDASADIKGAKKLGMHTIWTYQGGGHKDHIEYADHIISDIRKVEEILHG